MRLVAVHAGHPLCMHLALQKGTEYIDFVLDLAIRVVEAFFQQGQLELVMVGGLGIQAANNGAPE